ncbi:hybrid sensor histidine kinase/response regulator transcription factor [Chitinophaga eiseniae]|uniref:histidine kinase n=1 Tax=Chitinophaga eiseniae TaxID=634771 RepID=A0A847S9C7_9BACT|nr:hybrid sensor histidine kinase/response regulator transcription factor [Chitinophaga eiseniae]NLR78401.1 response regulator [Chitinophaga eiseniae]
MSGQRLRNNIHFFFVFLLTTCYNLQLLHAQERTFRHLNMDNGLIQNTILAITQDQQGFMWLGGRYGLNRYDGAHFKVYKSDYKDSTTLSFDNVISLLVDRQHILWVGTRSGLNKYLPEKDIFKRIFPEPPGTIGSDIECIYEDHHGILWLGTIAGLYRQTLKNSESFLPVEARFPDNKQPSPLRNEIKSICEDAQGKLWIGSMEGLICLEQQKNVLSGKVFRKEDNKGLQSNMITTVVPDRRDPWHLWIGTNDQGLYSYDQSTGQFKNIPICLAARSSLSGNNIRSITCDKRGKLWIGTFDGLYIYDTQTNQLSHVQNDPDLKQGLSQNSIFSTFEDKAGSIWIGTYYGGVNIADNITTPFTVHQYNKYRSSVSNNVISSFAEDSRHNFWIGTDGGGINYFNAATGQFTSYKSQPGKINCLSSNLVKTLICDREGNLWIGTHGGGLDVLTSAGKQFKKFTFENIDTAALTSEVKSILEDSQGRFWVGTQMGLRLFQRHGSDLQPFTENIDITRVRNSYSAHFIIEDSRKNIWVATARKLYILKNGSTSFTPFNLTKDSVANTTEINCIKEDHQGTIWFGTYSIGLIAYSPKKNSIQSFTKENGLPDNNILSIEEDNSGQLWISTNNALSSFQPETGICRSYTVEDGLMTSGFNYNSSFKAANGQLLFGGYNGFTIFSPKEIATNNQKAPLRFTSLDLFNKPVAIGGPDKILDRVITFKKKLDFNYDQNAFTIHFALLNFIKPEKNRYMYKMEPIEKEWNHSNTTSATYTGLPPGHYTFYVKGANNDGMWGEPQQMQIQIYPPFWSTWWAYCLYFILLASILSIIFRYFLLRELVKKENALYHAKLNFFTNISHEIRTHLALIIGPIEKMQLRQRDREDLRQLQYVKKNSDNLLQLVGELMDFRKAESGYTPLHVAETNIVSFARDIYATFEDVASSRNIQTAFNASSDNIPLLFDGKQMTKVFVNLLSNAFKFTQDGGMVTMLIEEQTTLVEISVTDNGRGIAHKNLDRLFENFFQENDYGQYNTGYGIGLALSKSIIDLHNGQIYVESEMGVKTCFTVSLLKGCMHLSATPGPLEARRKNTHHIPHLPAQTLDPTESHPVQAPNGPGENKYNILIVEDNHDLRSFLVQTLHPGYNILESADGIGGFASATTEIPDLIISDVMMPGMDGFTLCGKLKLDERTSHIPIILLTAQNTTPSQINGLQMGADRYITKPFSIHILELHMYNLLVSREKIRKKYSQQQPARDNATINSIDDLFLQKAISFIEENMSASNFGVPLLATHMLMSQPILYKKIKAITDMSVNDFMKQVRLKKAASLLREKRFAVYEVMNMVGYNDRKHFTSEFKKMFDVTPGDYARQ